MKSKNYYASLDLAKIIMAILVVAIHTKPLYYISNNANHLIYNTVVNYAVPFFFITSGFLLAEKLEWPYDSSESRKQITIYLKKILYLYIIWNLIYMPLTVIGYINYQSVTKIIIDFILGLFFIGEHYNSWILWYLLSTIYSLIMICFLLKHHISPYKIFIIGSILYIFGSLIDFLANYERGDEEIIPNFLFLFSQLMRYVFRSGRLFRGMGYFCLGIIVQRLKIPTYIDGIFFISGFIGQLIIIDNQIIQSLFLYVSAGALFKLIQKIKLKDRLAWPFIRLISTIIYFIHLYVWTIWYTLIYQEKTYGCNAFISTMILSIIISLLLGWLIKTKKCKHLQNIF